MVGEAPERRLADDDDGNLVRGDAHDGDLSRVDAHDGGSAGSEGSVSADSANPPPPVTPRSKSYEHPRHVRFSTEIDRMPMPGGSRSSADAGAHPPPLPTPRSKSYEHPHRVRFSAEIDRMPMPRGSRASADAGAASPPALSVDTRSLHESAAAGGAAGAPDSAAPLPSIVENTVPTTPRSRDRGFSLRRALFNRSIHPPTDASIELGEAGRSHGLPAPQRPADSRMSMDSTVTDLDDALDDSDLPPPERKFTDGLGLSTLPHYENWIRNRAARSRVTRHIKHAVQRTRKFILRISEVHPSKDGRHVPVSAVPHKARLLDERTGKPYVGNAIRSSRYTVWSFFPRQLWAQFSRLANAYFLFVGVLQMIPGLSTTGTYTTIAPLMFFVGISMGKEGYDDFRRYRLDREENNKDAHVLRAYEPIHARGDGKEIPESPDLGPKVWTKVKWRDVHVGDIVKLDRNEAVPADLVLLHAHGENGTAYIETMALDGETSLKSKQPTASLARTCDTLDRLATSNVHIVVEDPNLDLYNFEGRVTAGGETVPLTNGEVIYRGSVLRNTVQAIGLVVYSGEECKIRMNASKNPRIKAPSLQFIVNKVVIIMVIFVLALALGNTIAYEVWQESTGQYLWYLSNVNVSFMSVLVSFIIMFNTMIPLSLYVSLEIIKVFQRMLLNDLDMYDEETDTPMEARTSTINEELGQISYIFSDKTGTLTDNCMKFRKLSVAGTAWLHDPDLKLDAAKEMKKRQLLQRRGTKGKRPARISRSESHEARPSVGSAFPTSHDATQDEVLSPRWKSSARPTKAQPEMPTIEMIHYIQRRPFTVFARQARFFLLSMALCHSCLPETREDGSINYQAASPDELALVQAAQEMGYMVMDRQSGIITVKTFPRGEHAEPQLEKYHVLHTVEFSSKRKRMSVVVRFPDQRVCVITKGADSVMVRLLRLSALAHVKVAEIERRTSMRKSVEAQQAMARKSGLAEGRSSTTLNSPRMSGFGRTSMDRSPFREHVSEWLTERETDVDASVMDRTAAYAPRLSIQSHRPSVASEAWSSMTDDDFELVEEALAVDEAAVIERCFQHVNDFATEGLRTLLYGHRFLDEAEYESWRDVYRIATTSLVDRKKMIEKAGELIEHGFELGGATAIEDKLQKGVPETIDKLRRANIKLWMLTGDKRETAINIGHSCRLIKDYSTVTVLDHGVAGLEQLIASTIVAIDRGSVAHSVVVLDGQTLAAIEASCTLKSLFVDLAPMTDSVICCRASPSQKALLVRAVRRKVKSSITLAIGDGANDIAMIQEAHVGIGITGKEGLQAARTSDYSIARFRFLSKLLLVHGRWNYVRTAKYTLATFWKETLFYLTQALFQRYTGYTGTSLYEPWSLTTFNTLFTSLPVLFLGIFHQDLRAATLLAAPELYAKGQRNAAFNLRIYLFWFASAAAESLLIFFTAVALFAANGAASSLAADSIYPLGTLTYTAVVTVVATKLQLLEMRNIAVPSLIAIALYVGGWFAWCSAMSIIYAQNGEYKVRGAFLEEFGRDASWWATLGLVLAAVAALEIGLKAGKGAWWPTETDVFRVLEGDAAVRRRFEEASGLEMPSRGASGVLVEEKGEMQIEKEVQMEKEIEEAQRQREGEVAELLRCRAGGEADHAQEAMGAHGDRNPFAGYDSATKRA